MTNTPIVSRELPVDGEVEPERRALVGTNGARVDVVRVLGRDRLDLHRSSSGRSAYTRRSTSSPGCSLSSSRRQAARHDAGHLLVADVGGGELEAHAVDRRDSIALFDAGLLGGAARANRRTSTPSVSREVEPLVVETPMTARGSSPKQAERAAPGATIVPGTDARDARLCAQSGDAAALAMKTVGSSAGTRI